VPEKQIMREHMSGVKRNRPQLDHALKGLREGDVLVVWKLDRLGRSLKDLVELAEYLEANKIQLRSLTEGVDTTTALGKFFYHIMAALAQFERDLISERTVAGLEAAKLRGTWKARKPTIDRAQWAHALEILADNPHLSPYKLAPIVQTNAVTGKRPTKSTLHNYMDLLREGAVYPWGDEHD
ncbi:MAG: recombinase family protein, partial [Kordiimonadaceae bacterium]|nr:recombinase family protein [Kordiimonadaceae bacterium]